MCRPVVVCLSLVTWFSRCRWLLAWTFCGGSIHKQTRGQDLGLHLDPQLGIRLIKALPKRSQDIAFHAVPGVRGRPVLWTNPTSCEASGSGSSFVQQVCFLRWPFKQHGCWNCTVSHTICYNSRPFTSNQTIGIAKQTMKFLQAKAHHVNCDGKATSPRRFSHVKCVLPLCFGMRDGQWRQPFSSSFFEEARPGWVMGWDECMGICFCISWFAWWFFVDYWPY